MANRMTNNRRFALAMIILDWLQLIIFIIGPSFPWAINESFWFYKIIYSVQFQVL